MLPPTSSPPNPSSLLPPDLAEKVATLPLDQLPELLRAQAEKTYRASLGYNSPDEEIGVDHITSRAAPPPAPLPGSPAPADHVPADAVGAGDPGLPDVDPALVQKATTILAGEGLLPAPTSELTPDVMAVLHGLAQADAPGLYDLNNPQDLTELLNGVINGIVGRPGPSGGNPVASG